MKKILFSGKTIILITLLFILTSCAKPEETYTITEENGTEVISNSGLPNQLNFQIKLKELFTLKGYDEEQNLDENAFYHLKKMTIAPDGAIYILDDTSFRVSKFSKLGEYELHFLRQGKGPGEVANIKVVNLFNDNKKVIIRDYRDLHYFDFEGNFLEKETVLEVIPFRLPLELIFLANNQIIKKGLGVDYRGDDMINDVYFIRDIALCDSNYVVQKELDNRIETCRKDSFRDIEDSFIYDYTLTVSSTELFVHNRSLRSYEINCYDLELNKTQTIRMPNISVKYNQNELNYIEENFVGVYAADEYWKGTFDTKLCLNHLHFDEKSNLLLVEHVPDLDNQSIKFDVFRKGIFLTSFDYTIEFEDYNPMNRDFMFKVQDGRFYAYSETNNAVSVFEIVLAF